MRCFHPIKIGVQMMPCGRCPACLANRQRSWAFRLTEEKNNCSWFHWLTLSYAEEYLPKSEDGRPMVYKPDCRAFFEKLRKTYPKLKFKHFLASEYGPNPTDGVNHRPHYHLCLFVYSPDNSFNYVKLHKERLSADFSRIWGKGFVTERDFHSRVFTYVAKYCCKPELLGIEVPVKPFTLISQGIGKSYLARLNIQERKDSLNFVISYKGKNMQLPRYYKDKINPVLHKDSNPLANKNYWRMRLQSYELEGELEKKYQRAKKAYEDRHKNTYEQHLDSIAAHEEQTFINKLKERQDV